MLFLRFSASLFLCFSASLWDAPGRTSGDEELQWQGRNNGERAPQQAADDQTGKAKPTVWMCYGRGISETHRAEVPHTRERETQWTDCDGQGMRETEWSRQRDSETALTCKSNSFGKAVGKAGWEKSSIAHLGNVQGDFHQRK